MRTPAGKDCRYYYADFHRGRDVQECRLVKQNPDSLAWRPGDCMLCNVPDILNANASPDLELHLMIKSRMLGMRRDLIVQASCVRHRVPIENPYVGCPQCNAERSGLDVFWKALEQDDDND